MLNIGSQCKSRSADVVRSGGLRPLTIESRCCVLNSLKWCNIGNRYRPANTRVAIVQSVQNKGGHEIGSSGGQVLYMPVITEDRQLSWAATGRTTEFMRQHWSRWHRGRSMDVSRCSMRRGSMLAYSGASWAGWPGRHCQSCADCWLRTDMLLISDPQ